MRRHRNYGATCYLNALLQSMTGLPRTPSVADADGLAGRFFACCRTGSADLASVVKEVRRVLGPGQQDAHDLWTAVADELYEGDDKTSFHGKFQVEVRCRACGFAHQREEPFHSLALKRSASGGAWDLTKGLHNILRRETLEGYRCDSCRAVGRSVRSVRLAALPEVLVCHVARFEYGLSGGARKIGDPFSYPHTHVDLRNLSGGQPALYRLHAVIDHFGTLSNGHYVARRQSADGVWHVLDDDRPAQPKPFRADPGCRQLTSDDTVYMLVFQRL